MIRLFVYGTLLAGEPYHHLLNRSPSEGPAHTNAGYALLHLGEYPAMVIEPAATGVRGEVYRVDAPTLDQVDAYEDCPALYQRLTIALRDAPPAIAYVLRDEHRAAWPIISEGDWRAVRNSA